ncbi:MAG TPA: heavy metal sensor histidine kinase [Planctomycetota bacterium]|nr:heavy metal sensor histidine kinase [Planctomycetota bacterium]
MGEAGAPAPAPRSLSLATRVAAAFAIAVFLLCTAVSFTLDRSVEHAMETELAESVSNLGRQVALNIAEQRGTLEDLRDLLRHVSLAYTRPRMAVIVRREGGEFVTATADAERLFPPETRRAALEQARDALGDHVTPDSILAGETFAQDDRRHRWTFERRIARDAAGDPYDLLILGNQRELDHFVARFRRSLVQLVLPLMIGAFIAAYALVRRTMRHLERVTTAAARIGSRNLGERLDVRRAPSEIARLVTSFNDMLDRLEDAFRRLQEFGADLAHELRTPIQNLRGEAEVALLNPRTPAEYEEILGGMIEECGALARIVDDVLLLARVERHEEALEIEPFDLAAEIEALREYFGDVASGRGVRLAATAPAALPVEGDRAKLRRAIANVLDNALKYTDAGGLVTVTARDLGADGAEVAIEDTGIGIPKADLPKIFQRFYRVEKSRSRIYGGAGLGMGIARTLVRAHGGDVTIESEVGKGTRVVIRLAGKR